MHHLLESYACIILSFSNKCNYNLVLVENILSILITQTGLTFIFTHHCPLHLNSVIVTPNNIKNLFDVRKCTKDNKVSINLMLILIMWRIYRLNKLSLDVIARTTSIQLHLNFLSSSIYKSVYLSSKTETSRLPHSSISNYIRFISCNKNYFSLSCHACFLKTW